MSIARSLMAKLIHGWSNSTECSQEFFLSIGTRQEFKCKSISDVRCCVSESKRAFLIIVSACISCVLMGCSKGEQRLPTHQVVGKVLRKGAGLPNATVVFHAKDSAKGFFKPRATTNANGEFVLTTYESGDGAPAGEYEVTLEQWIFLNPEVGATNRLPNKLGVPSTSGLKATVAKTANSIPAFELR